MSEWQTDTDFRVLRMPEQSDWKCYLFGSKPGGMGIVYTPTKGDEPNWFWRKMQFWAFGNRWVYEPKIRPPS